jgi:nucleoside-diphosphate-sugar epimerase
MEGDPQMRVLVAGATSALGRPLVRRLVRAGHEVIGTTHSPRRRSLVERLGGQGLVLDALDRAAVAAAVAQARPDAVIHALTALPPAGPVRLRELAATNRLRVEGTANLVAAAQQAQVGGSSPSPSSASTGWGAASCSPRHRHCLILVAGRPRRPRRCAHSNSRS